MTLKASLASVLLVASTTVFAAESTVSLTTELDRTSYAIGANIGGNLKHTGGEIDLYKLEAGLRDALAGAKIQLTPEEISKSIKEFQTKARDKQMAERKIEGEKAVKEGADFLAANKKKEGVVTLPSGLQYKIIKQGDGVKPKATDTVKTQYRGTFPDGTEFDSSYKRNQPATFPVNGVIKGWTEALQLMPVGSKWQLFIPSDLAYGAEGRPGIPPNAALVFDIELLEVVDNTK